MRLFVTILAMLVPCSMVWATDYYVDAANVTPPFDGTSGDPYPSIQYALEHGSGGTSWTVTTGDTIHVQSGVYPQAPLSIVTVNTNGTGAARNVKIIGEGPTKPIIGSATPGSPYLTGPAIIIAGGQSSACELENLAIQGWDSTANLSALIIVPHTTNGGSSPRIENVEFRTNLISGMTGNFLDMGGAVVIYEYCNPTLLLCHFEGNEAGDVHGAGLYGGAIGIGAITISATTPSGIGTNAMPRPVISSCSFIANTSKCRGGAISMAGAAPIISNCEFRNNSASDGGGAIFCKMTDGLRVEGCEFYGNNGTSTSGGAILASWTVDDDGVETTDADPIRIIWNTFGSTDSGDPGNYANAGAAVLIANADCTVSHNRFFENEAVSIYVPPTSISRGAALGIVGIDTIASGSLGAALGVTIDPTDDIEMTALVVNNLFGANTFFVGAPDQSAVWVCSDDATVHSIKLTAFLVNNTVTEHDFASLLVEEGSAGSGLTSAVSLYLQNSILWDPPITPQVDILGSPGVKPNYNDSNETLTGTGNITSNPLFNAPPEDVTLTSGSPCINAGLNSYWLSVRALDPYIPDRDLSGGPRGTAGGGTIDIGCEER